MGKDFFGKLAGIKCYNFVFLIYCIYMYMQNLSTGEVFFKKLRVKFSVITLHF